MLKKFKILVAIPLLLIAACQSGGRTSGAQVAIAPDQEKYVKLVVVGTNDFHGFLRPIETDFQGAKIVASGAEWLAGHLDVLKRHYGDRLVLLDAGDQFQGTLESNPNQGEAVVKVFNEIGYQAAAVGNHEFDYGPASGGNKRDRLGAIKRRMAEAKYPYLAANIFKRSSEGKQSELWREKNLFPSTMITAGGFKIGIIGLSTRSTPATTRPQNVVDLEFGDFTEATLREEKKLRAQGADLIFITTHEAGEEKGEPICELLKNLPAGTVDAVVAGHYHTKINMFIHGVPVIESKAYNRNFGRIDLYVDKATKKVEPKFTKIYEPYAVCGTWFADQESCDVRKPGSLPLRAPMLEGEVVKPNLKIRALLQPYFKKADKIKAEPLGVAERNFEFIPSGESEVGTLFIDAMLERFPEAKVVYLNGGGFRRAFLKGPITYGDLYEVHPFDNQAVTVKMNGAQLKDLLRVGVAGSRSMPALWGVNVEYYNTSEAKFLRDVNGDGKQEDWERDRLAKATWYNGKEVKDSDTFWLATNDYLSGGGDNTQHVFGAIPAKDMKTDSLTMRDVAARFLRQNKGMRLPRSEPAHIRSVK